MEKTDQGTNCKGNEEDASCNYRTRHQEGMSNERFSLRGVAEQCKFEVKRKNRNNKCGGDPPPMISSI